MALTTVTGLTAVLAADLDDTAVIEVEDNDVASRKSTIAQLRTALSAAAWVFTSTSAPQIISRYDASNHWQLSVSSAGAVTYNATGAGALHTFSDGVVVTTGGLTVSAGTTAVQALTATTGTFTGLISGTKTTNAQATFSGFSTIAGGVPNLNGQIFLGDGAASSAQGSIQYNTAGNTVLYIDNGYDNASAAIWLRTRTNGVAVNALKLDATTAVFGSLALSGITELTAAKLNTASGTTSALNDTFTTIFTAAGDGTYFISGEVVGSQRSIWVAHVDGSVGSSLTRLDGGIQMNAQWSGLNLQMKHTVGSTQNIVWRYVRLG